MQLYVESVHENSDIERPQVTRTQVRNFMRTGWGSLGEQTHDAFELFNAAFFSEKIKPTPITLVSATPYGHWVGLTHCRPKGAGLIELQYNAVKQSMGKCVLLHEMIHAFLSQKGLSPAHAKKPWCQEIVRISKLLGHPIWAAPGRVGKVKIDGEWKSKRFSGDPCPETGKQSLTQTEISQWPNSVPQLARTIGKY
jgi:hypothetical protein